MSWAASESSAVGSPKSRFDEPDNSAIVSVSRGLISVEQQRAIAEVQARMLIARHNPRDYMRCIETIKVACQRPALAQSAFYEYPRGAQRVSGPSIRLAEAIAQRWGNIASGIKVLSRENGYSECVAYAWDLETGYYDERQFQVKHWRETKEGGYAITDERDIYELEMNMGQRRKRAVLLTVIPGDVVEAAADMCEATLKANADTSPDALKKMLEAFAMHDVSREMIEGRYQCHLEAIRPVQVIELRKIFNSMKDGMSAPKDWFQANPVAVLANQMRRTEGSKAAREVKDEEPTRVAQQSGEKPQRRTRTAQAEPEVTPPAAVPIDAPKREPVGVPPAFEAELLDEVGEAVVSPDGSGAPVILHTPLEYAKWLNSQMAMSQNPFALWENNKDNTDAALATGDEEARQVIDDAERGLERREKEQAAQAGKEAPADKDMQTALSFVRDFDNLKTVHAFEELKENKAFATFWERIARESPNRIYPLLLTAVDAAVARLGLPPIAR